MWKRACGDRLIQICIILQENEFWNDQIEQIYVYPDNDIELIPRVGNHRIMLGTLDEFEEKLANLKLSMNKRSLKWVGKSTV